MTNLTNSSTNLTNSTKQEAISMEDINKSALVSTMGAELYHNGLSPSISLVVAVAFMGAVDYIEDDFEDFMEAFMDGLENTTVEVVKSEQQPTDELDGELIQDALVGSGYFKLDPELGLGSRFSEICSLRSEAYAPTTGDIERRFNYAQVTYSDLFVEAIHALEATEYTVDSDMLSLALQVQAALGADNDDEGYVIKGCQAMDSELAYKSEFKGDRRGRMYQAACHGPNGQASDRSRALMNLVDVPTDYDINTVKKHIMAELADMTGDVTKAAKQRKELGDVEFILTNLISEEVKKPWSFVKAARIMSELQAGNRPYIGMAVGLDAKCSGPQLGALMVGDQQIAAACGMTLVEVADAYHRAIEQLEKAGFVGIDRAGIKKAYMGVFYGQGYMAYTSHEVGEQLWTSMYGSVQAPANDDIAKSFHKALTASFGSKMVGVRQLVRNYADTTTGRTKHFMPDGFEVAMNYKEQVNIHGELMMWDTAKYDVRLRNNAETYKFINFQLRTMETHVGDFARNGFVNMIQATDALVARLIIVHLKRLGAKHIISVHDCFRVNVTEMHLLEQAIKLAYMDLFGNEWNNATKDLPMGTDILGLYFEGANRQLVDGVEPVMVSQFFESGKRRMKKVGGVAMNELINSLGTSYYFAK
jgi:hypothetical protein